MPPTLFPSEHAARTRAMVDLHHGFVWRLLCRLGVPESDADDAAQHVFLTAAGMLGEVPTEREQWLLTDITRKIAANARRKSTRRAELGLTPMHEDMPAALAREQSHEEQLDQRTALSRLDDLLASMPDEQREAFSLFELENMSIDQVAELLEVPRGTVASRIRLARERIARDMVRLGAQRGGARA